MKWRVYFISSSLLQGLNSMAVLGDTPEAERLNSRRILGVKVDGSMWIYCLVQYATMLLNQSKYVQIVHALSPEQRQGWDRWGILLNTTRKVKAVFHVTF